MVCVMCTQNILIKLHLEGVRVHELYNTIRVHMYGMETTLNCCGCNHFQWLWNSVLKFVEFTLHQEVNGTIAAHIVGINEGWTYMYFAYGTYS